MQLYGVSRLYSYMVSVGCEVIWELLLHCPLHPHPISAFKTPVENLPGGGRQFPTNNIKFQTSFELVNSQYIY